MEGKEHPVQYTSKEVLEEVFTLLASLLMPAAL